MWHHELEVPAGFIDAYPEILNEDGDIEVTHPIIRDFLENKIEDFFYEYPKIDGLILTLHETRIPILKLKHQKLEPVERVRYVTEILYESCKKLGKELVVCPFASIEKDYEEMLKISLSALKLRKGKIKEENGDETVRIRFDRTSKETPYIYFVETESK